MKQQLVERLWLFMVWFCLDLNGRKACVKHTKGNQVTVGTFLCFAAS